MKRRTFIAKGLGAGMAVTASHSILAGNSWDKTEEVTTEGVRVEEGKVRELPVFWDQLTSPDFREAVTRANGVCVIPIGVIEKHGRPEFDDVARIDVEAAVGGIFFTPVIALFRGRGAQGDAEATVFFLDGRLVVGETHRHGIGALDVFEGRRYLVDKARIKAFLDSVGI